MTGDSPGVDTWAAESGPAIFPEYYFAPALYHTSVCHGSKNSLSFAKFAGAHHWQNMSYT
jgi:hypothetical protein